MDDIFQDGTYFGKLANQITSELGPAERIRPTFAKGFTDIEVSERPPLLPRTKGSADS